MEELGSGLKGDMATVRKISNVENRSREERGEERKKKGNRERGERKKVTGRWIGKGMIEGRGEKIKEERKCLGKKVREEWRRKEGEDNEEERKKSQIEI
jgi:hypothetical protein